VPDDALAEAVLQTYGVSMHQVREAFELLEGSFVKRVRNATAQTWQVHHPSMIEALQEELSTKSSQLVLYLQSARMPVILRDTTTVSPAPNSRLVFLPDSVYPYLLTRFQSAGKYEFASVAQYLAHRASDELLLALEAACPDLLDRALAIIPEPYGEDTAPSLAMRLYRVRGASLLGEKRRWALIEALAESVDDYGWAGFLDINDINSIVPELIAGFLKGELENGFHSFKSLYDWHAGDLSSTDHIDSALEALNIHASRLQKALSSANLLSNDAKASLASAKEYYEGRLHERRAEIEENEERRAEYYEDEWKERWHEERYEREFGRFADIDE
jgi:hypothetical protein